ncbi:hypothetical protein RZ532_00940 [Nitratireductor aquimarinus]|uniref:hypothetical protein n=1 Tax=Nitratireductor aquimarinus TaxID=889300 RepID=UPI0029361870|nr:hypothetical protein [Nitratireductor aquimarinus]MDV2964526.1 hypothetical protein [Nitratireductor aquimarinus]
MGNVWVREFTGGLDARRLPETSPGGTLMRLRDAHINRGGEIEQRAIFEKVYDLPEGETHGLAATKDGLVVFGHQGVTSTPVPAGVAYQALAHPNGEAMRDVQFTELFRGKLQVIAEYEDDKFFMFFDGARVTDTDAPPNKADSGEPKSLLTTASKMFVASGPNMFFSAVGDSTDFGEGAGAGSGFIVMSTHAQGADELTGLGLYNDYVAVFARRVILVWYVDPDPALSRKAQVLNNTGAIASRSITQFGDGDVFYLDRSGIRSLRARDSSNSAATTDIGSPVDPLVTEKIVEIGDAGAAKAIGLIEPRDGRFWQIVGDRIYVFSYFSSSKVSAWSEYLPGFTIDAAVVWDSKVWVRSGDEIWVYGGVGDKYRYSEDVPAEVWLPYLDADEPFRAKNIEGVDAAVRGTWEFRLAMDLSNHDASDLVARIDHTTFSDLGINTVGETTHFSPRLRATAPESEFKPAILSSVVVHFDRDKEEDN